MKPEKILSEYVQDIRQQQKVALKNDNMIDAKKMQTIIEDFNSALNLLEYWRKNYTKLKIVRKKDAV